MFRFWNRQKPPSGVGKSFVVSSRWLVVFQKCSMVSHICSSALSAGWPTMGYIVNKLCVGAGYLSCWLPSQRLAIYQVEWMFHNNEFKSDVCSDLFWRMNVAFPWLHSGIGYLWCQSTLFRHPTFVQFKFFANLQITYQGRVAVGLIIAFGPINLQFEMLRGFGAPVLIKDPRPNCLKWNIRSAKHPTGIGKRVENPQNGS